MSHHCAQGLPPKILIFEADYQQLDQCGFRKRQLIGATLRIPQTGQQADFTVSVGIDGCDRVYVEVGDVRGERRAVFHPQAIPLQQ